MKHWAERLVEDYVKEFKQADKQDVKALILLEMKYTNLFYQGLEDEEIVATSQPDDEFEKEKTNAV